VFRPRAAGTPGKAGRRCLCREGLWSTGQEPNGQNAGSVGCLRASLPRRAAPNHRLNGPDSTPTKSPVPFNAHSQGGGGCGSVQHVLRSPARILAAGCPRGRLCAAPASVKRCTLSWRRLLQGRVVLSGDQKGCQMGLLGKNAERADVPSPAPAANAHPATTRPVSDSL
jgi:hypothetical protein